MQEEILEALRNPFLFAYAYILLTWCVVVSGSHLGDTVELEFKAYRLQQYDVIATSHGSRSWKVMFEAVSLDGNALRRCLVVSWRDLIGRDLNKVFSHAVGSVLIIIPADYRTLSVNDRASFSNLERRLMTVNTDMAVYFAHQQPELNSLLADVSVFSKRAPSAVKQLYNAIAGNTFQFSSSASISNNVINPYSANVVGRLWSSDRSSPTIVFVAHYDSHSIVPALSKGSDSNGSGVVVLLELLAIFSRFYANVNARPKYNMVFIFSSGGKFNYQGSRQWIEDHIEKQIEENIEVVICVDTVGKGKEMLMHVSKMPSDDAPAARLLKRLQASSPVGRNVGIVSKKINLNADSLAWEHERYSVRRLPAFTLSHLRNHNDLSRTSLLDTPEQLDQNAIEMNVRTIGEAVLAHIFKLRNERCPSNNATSACTLLKRDNAKPYRIAHWIEKFASSPRPLAGNNEKFVADLRDIVAKYTAGHATVQPVSLVDVSLYGVLEDKLTAHRVKPAVFELLLAAVIALYLSVLYMCALNVHSFIEAAIVKLKKA
ncbi:hypothetical protein AB6A40_008454 [Gnathostoma spinigerum]|uniref:BOS complex subunit NCLN n=1 Tax=Gnathostoma spinigerum TaxID=75299 RepID=A0ABD6EQD8_9BILA